MAKQKYSQNYVLLRSRSGLSALPISICVRKCYRKGLKSSTEEKWFLFLLFCLPDGEEFIFQAENILENA